MGKENRFLDTLYTYKKISKFFKIRKLKKEFKDNPIISASTVVDIIQFWKEIESSCLLFFVNFAAYDDRLVITTQEPNNSKISIIANDNNIIYINIINQFGNALELDIALFPKSSNKFFEDTYSDNEMHLLRKITKLLYDKTLEIIEKY